jgi:protein associated with RNAse G/E
MQKSRNITIIKLDHTGKETWRYFGELIELNNHFVTIEAFFDRADIEFHGMTLAFGDRFIETYYFERWYNIFEIFDKADNHLKGWYCNVSSPAQFQNNTISYKDLALDLLVFPNGHQIILDEDEFNAINLGEFERSKAMEALSELQTKFNMS